MEILKLENVWKTYKMGEETLHALEDITLNINKGDFIAIIGASGSGKSTLMNIIGLIDRPTQGEVYINKENITDLEDDEIAELRGKTIGFIFQQYNLIKNMNAYENICLPLKINEFNKEDSKKKVNELMALVGISDKKNHFPNQLSGGQQQRVAVARALVNEPKIILADEPTGALDSKTGKDIINMLKKLNKMGKTIILITHDLNLAKNAKKQIKLKDGKLTK